MKIGGNLGLQNSQIKPKICFSHIISKKNE